MDPQVIRSAILKDGENILLQCVCLRGVDVVALY